MLSKNSVLSRQQKKYIAPRLRFNKTLCGAGGLERNMLAMFDILFKSVDELTQDRIAEFEQELDVLAIAQTGRYARGNAAIQQALFESEEQLDAKREITIARRL